MPSMHTRVARAAAVALPLLLLAAACSDDDDGGAGASTTATTSAAPASSTTTADDAGPAGTIVLNGQGNDLVAYAGAPPFDRQVVVTNATDDPESGRDMNGQICFDPDDPTRFVAGEDTHQDTTGHPGWGIFELSGDTVGELSATQVAKLVPTYQAAEDNAENYGCGFLPDGRIVTTDVGNQANGQPDGQLTVWFPPFDLDFTANRYCKVDVDLSTGQGILVTDTDVIVAEARRPAVSRYPIASLPTSDDAAGGCGATDGTGAPMVDPGRVTPEPFIVPGDDSGVVTPTGIAAGPDGHVFISSVFNGVISEFLPDGTFVRRVLEPPAGETLSDRPFSTGTPLGIGVAPDGTIYFADIGVVVSPEVGPGDHTGSVRRIAFVDGQPQPPDTMDTGLAFPDGIGIVPAR